MTRLSRTLLMASAVLGLSAAATSAGATVLVAIFSDYQWRAR